MTLPLYASPEQLMRERSELARKGIARGRSVVVLKYRNGVLFVAENPSTTLHKFSEIYDRIGFAAVGRYSEFENLRVAGIRHADLKGYQYDRRDVSARALANAYAATLGSIFTEQLKPYEVEICVAEVGASPAEDQLYRLTYDGSIFDEPQFVVMGGQTEPIVNKLKEEFEEDFELEQALPMAVKTLRSTSPHNGDGGSVKLEVAVLDRTRPRRAFRRITGEALEALLPAPEPEPADEGGEKPADQEGSGTQNS
ncbi:proteasome subunit alpha [Amycolatopsis rhizosphaerae]|uniref:Proteasome subunit alpha n=1 Tax=Amycolatopsis rhizosphaerae TaxID=2053003 RepID=A0A558AWL8_9PSEU|nr:proteasome subunit alpha [Amycolatopsis rhizosphaerae]TVT28667.1 proteasome subunit alpha [Amycolatopsis rhizosphaerae]